MTGVPVTVPSAPIPGVARDISRGAVAAIAATVVVGGVGGRLAMRLSFLIDAGARGVITENGARVGEITAGGTVALVIFGGLFAGLGAAVLWVIVRPWMPSKGSSRYAAGAAVGIGLGARMAIDGRNFDFRILDPPLIQAALFVGLAALTGSAIVWADEQMEHRLPPPFAGAAAGYVVVAAVGLLLAGPILRTFFVEETCICLSTPRLPGLLVIGLAMLTGATWLQQMRGRPTPGWFRRLGGGLLVAAVASGLAHLIGEIAHFA